MGNRGTRAVGERSEHVGDAFIVLVDVVEFSPLTPAEQVKVVERLWRFLGSHTLVRQRF